MGSFSCALNRMEKTVNVSGVKEYSKAPLEQINVSSLNSGTSYNNSNVSEGRLLIFPFNVKSVFSLQPVMNNIEVSKIYKVVLIVEIFC